MNERWVARKGRAVPKSEAKRIPPVPQDCIGAAMLMMRDCFSEASLGVGDTEFWDKFERPVYKNVLTKDVCFEFILAGYGGEEGPVKMAEFLLNKLTDAGINITRTPRRQYLQTYVYRLAGYLYNYYPDDYKRKFSYPSYRNDAS